MRLVSSSLRKPPFSPYPAAISSLTRPFRNLRRALQLPNIVADSRYSIFRDFVSTGVNRMPEYLAGVREAAIAVLGNGLTDPVQAVVG